MKNNIALLIIAVAFLSSCTSTAPLTKSVAYKGIYSEKPVTILIMPPINRSTNVDAKEYFHSTLNVPLANAGYYVIPPFLSMPEIRNNLLYNAGYLCRRDGTVERYEKLHVTPDEAKVWGLQGGTKLQVFDTDCGKIGVLICYDSEFPELSRLLADEGMNILFVPFLTDTQNGYSRVRYCAQARAIENECYVAIAGSVGNLPKVHNMYVFILVAQTLAVFSFIIILNLLLAESLKKQVQIRNRFYSILGHVSISPL